MALDEKLTESIQSGDKFATSTSATPATPTTAATPVADTASAPAQPSTQMAAPAYADQNRIAELNRMYEAQLGSQKNALETAYNQNLSDLESNRAKIAQQYQTQRNAAAADFERQRRNFNEQAAMNGINTGAFSQANLAQQSAYQKSQATLGASEAAANAGLDKSIADLKIKYQGDINNAVAENDYKKAAALLDEYNNAYSQALTKAQMLAQYGDFSGYSDIYGADNARQMSEVWAIQNPLIAYQTGRISVSKYRSITGHNPPGYSSVRRSSGSYSTDPKDPPDVDPSENKTGDTGSHNHDFGIADHTPTIAEQRAEYLAAEKAKREENWNNFRDEFMGLGDNLSKPDNAVGNLRSGINQAIDNARDVIARTDGRGGRR